MTEDNSVSVDGTTFTREQVDRQTKRIYEYVFISPTHDEDGSYGGRVNDDVLDCFQSNLVTDTVLEEDSVATMIQKIIMCVAGKISSNTKAVHPRIAEAFCSDFVPAAFEQFYTLQSAVRPADEFDPAYN